MEVLRKLKTELSCDAETPRLGIYLENTICLLISHTFSALSNHVLLNLPSKWVFDLFLSIHSHKLSVFRNSYYRFRYSEWRLLNWSVWL